MDAIVTEGSPDDAEEVRLRVAAKPNNARLIRLTVTALASRMAYSYDEIEDLRIAVGEVCGVLLDPGSEPTGSDRSDTSGGADRPVGSVGSVGSVEVVCTVREDSLRVTTVRSPGEPRPDVSELNRQILQAVTDEVEFDLHLDSPAVAFTKQRRT